MKLKQLIVTVIATLLSIGALAQNNDVLSVTVSDDQGLLPGASVFIKGTQIGGVSDIDGKTILKNVPSNAVIVVSSLGYKSVEEAVNGRKAISVFLQSDSKELKESVVVGYGTTKKVNLTGAVEAVGEETFNNRSMGNAARALEGAVSNLNISFSDGKEGRNSSVNIRGTTSIGQGGSALVLIDGVEGDISMVNPSDIESVSVLKDAASAAIYGARGTFGVVLITTKSAEKGTVSVTYNAAFSLKAPTMLPDNVTDGIEWAENFREANIGYLNIAPVKMNASQAYSDQWLQNFKDRRAAGITAPVEISSNGVYTYYGSTDWYDLLYKDLTTAQEHSVSIKGSTDKSSYFLSGRYYGFDGLYNYNPDTYKTYNLHAKASFDVSKWFTVSNNMEFDRNTSHVPSVARTDRTAIDFIELCCFPTAIPFNPDGTYTNAGAYTIGALNDNRNYKDLTTTGMRNTVSGTARFFDGKLTFSADFTIKYNHIFNVHKQYSVPFSNAEGVTSYLQSDQDSYAERNERVMYTASNIYGQYENTFKKHYLRVMAGYNYETSKDYSQFSSRNELLLPDAQSINLALSDQTFSISAVGSNWKILGLFYRVNYSFNDRYLLEFNGRYDGSSKFPQDQQYAFFPSYSAGWRVSKEPWWHVSPKAITSLKVRASYGSLGNGNVSPYKYMELLLISNATRVLGGATPRSISNPSVIPTSLTWETATATDFGLDASFLKGRMNFTGDYYIRRTTDMYTTGPTLPAIFGATEPKGNYADMTTSGWEVTLSWNDAFKLAGKAFHYGVKASVYDYTAVIDKFYNATGLYSSYYAGKKVGEIWGLRTDGLFQSEEDLVGYNCTFLKSNTTGSWRVGDIKFKDLNNDGAITYGKKTLSDPGDFEVIGNNRPRYQFSFNLNADWNGIFFSAFFNGVGHQDWYPSKESAFWGQYSRQYNSLPTWHLTNRWSEDNPDGYLPRYACNNGALCWSGYANDRYLQNAAFIRLKNLQIGYNIPSSLSRKVGIQNVKVYVSGENLWSWAPFYKWTGNTMDVFNATRSGDDDLGSDFGDGTGYPLLRTITLGLSVTF